MPNEQNRTAVLGGQLRQTVKHGSNLIRSVHVHMVAQKTLKWANHHKLWRVQLQCLFNVRHRIKRDGDFNIFFSHGLHYAANLEDPRCITTKLQETWHHSVSSAVFTSQQHDVAWGTLLLWCCAVSWQTLARGHVSSNGQ